jgi:DNA-binding MltR family transcriptional regulator
MEENTENSQGVERGEITADNKSTSNTSKHHWLSFFIEEFDKESDRAAVILTAAMLDESLKELIEAFLIPCSSSDDPLFDGANAPVGTFSSRIECAYRLGLISKNFAKCLHVMRKIRNSFAHDVAGCKFASPSVASRIRALKLATNTPDTLEGKKKDRDLTEPRRSFSYMAGYFMWQLKDHMTTLNQLSDSDAICCRFTSNKKA